MRVRIAVAAALVAALPSPVSAGLAEVRFGSCELRATNGSADCFVQLDPNPDAIFAQITESGFGSADLYCYVSGRSMHLSGGYGTEVDQWSHGPELCRLSLVAWDGTSSAYVD